MLWGEARSGYTFSLIPKQPSQRERPQWRKIKTAAEVLEQMVASPNYSVALLGIKATFIRFRLIDKY